MLKVISFITVCLFIVGCGADKSSSVKPNIYQSVTKNKAVLLQKGENKKYCAMCGMNLVKYYKTNHAAMYKNKQYQYCSIHCLEEHLEKGITLKNPMVVDISSLNFIPVMDAVYVVGSKKKGTMSHVSKYAFKSLRDAKDFQKEFGGEIMDFNGARKKAQEDFKFKRKY